jgi:hypothetical protein
MVQDLRQWIECKQQQQLKRNQSRGGESCKT